MLPPPLAAKAAGQRVVDCAGREEARSPLQGWSVQAPGKQGCRCADSGVVCDALTCERGREVLRVISGSSVA